MRAGWMCGVVLLTVAGCSAGRGKLAVALTPCEQAAAGCSAVGGKTVVTPIPCEQIGLASWYRPRNRLTADGTRDPHASLSAAHRSLPFGTEVRVIDRDNGRSVVVRIDDRGPFVAGRIIDLSQAAAQRLDMTGVARVLLQIPGVPGDTKACPFARSGHT